MSRARYKEKTGQICPAQCVDKDRPFARKYAEILLRWNCYYDIAVSFDSCMSWETNPDPKAFVNRVDGGSGNDFVRAMFVQ